MTPLAYRGNAGWRDMSEYAVHFTKPTAAESAYQVMLSILWDQEIRASGEPFGAARRDSVLRNSQRSACFSEIPLDLLDRLVARRQSSYGIGFHHDKLVESAGARVWYLDNEGVIAQHFKELQRRSVVRGIDLGDPLWQLTPFVDFPGEYPGGRRFEFEWEREWRVPGGLRFSPADVAFLFIPEDLHRAARSFFEDHEYENTGPAYLCPYIDPTWKDMGRIQQAFAGLP